MGWETKTVGRLAVIVKVPEIVGKQRARTVRANGVTRSYTPKKTVAFEDAIRDTWLEQVGNCYAGFPGPVKVSVLYERELAKSNPKFWRGRHDLGKPDADNVLKSVLDALNGVAYADDSQVVSAAIEKLPRNEHGFGNALALLVDYCDETYEKE